MKEPEKSTQINKADLHDEDNYPLFCFKYLSDRSFNKCRDHQFFIKYLKRLQSLSSLGWAKIRESDKHSFGMEKIPIREIKPNCPICVTPDVTHLHAFRAIGDNRPFLGLQNGRVFQVFFIETHFGDIYDH
ncbi:MAG TPA: hypothetical protein DEO70_12130 [Bacteroidales bacterium]|nr:MAG: hypothetical protein A2X11_10120 [Bacteroidetes bacterium GWE2_42_24]OFY25898.1 MAG: hypothetical protein A2X09_09495 [Bacteroidetes bacterium GWF2_43_11]HBZ67576.1 hypothetical protein [Bacteroidales bacterium]